MPIKRRRRTSETPNQKLKRLTTDKRKIKSKKPIYDGIQFKSNLEMYMYQELKKNDIETEYEPTTYTLIDKFFFPNNSYERMANGKGDMVNRGGKSIIGITYRPDFVGYDYVIECKGFGNEAFPLRWKLFKKYLSDNKLSLLLFKPQKRSECEEVCRLILEHRKRNGQKG